MILLYIGLILFVAPHLYSMLLPGARDSLKASLGENAFKGGYAIVALAGLALIVVGYSRAWSLNQGLDLAFVPPAWGRHVTMLLVLFGFILIGASHGKGYLKAWLHNPMSIGVALWALGHLLANGRVLDLYLFGTFLVIGVLDIVLCELRGKRPMHVPQLRSDVIAVVAGLVLYGLFLFGFHPYILGVPVV